MPCPVPPTHSVRHSFSPPAASLPRTPDFSPSSAQQSPRPPGALHQHVETDRGTSRSGAEGSDAPSSPCSPMAAHSRLLRSRLWHAARHDRAPARGAPAAQLLDGIHAHLACVPGSPELSKSYMDMAKVFTFPLYMYTEHGPCGHGYAVTHAHTHTRQHRAFSTPPS